MKKLAAILVALGAVAAACGSLGPTAATVEGSRISEQSVRDEMVQIRDNKDYRDAIALPDVKGEGGNDTFKAEFTAQVLTRQIYYLLVHEEIARRHLTITGADLKKARQTVATDIGNDPRTGQPVAGLGDKILAKFSSSYLDDLVRREAEIERLQGVLESVKITDADITRYYDEHRSAFVQVCAMHVLVDTKEAADKVKADLAGGADFATVAEAQSKDPSAKTNKGDLGCAPPDSYVKEFADAVKAQPVGQVGDPVHTQFGWHVIKVYERKAQALKDVADQIRQQLVPQGPQALGQWLAKTLTKVKIDVNPKYGSFVRDTAANQLPRVQPPPAPKGTTPPGGNPQGTNPQAP